MASNVPIASNGWGPRTHSVPSSPQLTPTLAMPSNDVSEASFNTHKDDKLPHDASVFVGSLPSNIDQGELTRMLTEHLSEHTQVKNIKVVRDSKGGVCAFVQCENAVSATALIQTLHSGVPKPFLGRVLRYEPARAFRTLLVSFRTPTKIVRHGGSNNLNLATYTSEVKLELPQSMRVSKHRSSRFHTILYNSDADRANEASASDVADLDNVIYLNPLDFTQESLHNLVSYFGPLERFSALQSTKVDGNKEHDRYDTDRTHDVNTSLYLSYPVPHNAPRSSSMDSQCWEVKWEHRDDCVSALMTLRRVPHLTATWAHQPAATTYQAHSSPSYALPIQHCSLPFQTFASPNGSINTHSQPTKSGIEFVNGATATVDRTQILPSEGFFDRTPAARKAATLTSVINHAEKKDQEQLSDPSPSWVDSDLSSAPGQVADVGSKGDVNGPRDESEEYPNGEITHVTGDNEDQELYMPRTPALDKASITPNTPGSQFPITPTSYSGYDTQGMHYDDLDEKSNIASCKGLRSDREIDPMTLFVGGLEMYGPGAWDEEKVKNFFSRFGGLESVKVVRPLNSCAAFAFVKFNNAEAPARAVLEEHNRVYEGRAMRVQLRDCNPPRNGWKYGRGRGRHHQNQYGTQRRFHYRTPYDADPSHLQNGSRHIYQDSDNTTDHQFSSLSATLVSVKLSSSEDNDVGSNSVELASSSDVSSVARNTAPSEKYREWYDEPVSSTNTPEPSIGSSISVGGPPTTTPPYAYPIPQGQFFPSQTWMQPLLSQATYQMPYYPGYAPIYPPTVPHSSQLGHGNPLGADFSGPAPVAQSGWSQMGVYASYIPYPAVFPRATGIDQAPVPPLPQQAPLIPTGFIQNEQGTLIPVYQPEALDQYMAASSGHSPAVSNPQRWNNNSPYQHELNNASVNAFAQANQAYTRSKPTGVASTMPQQLSNLQQASAPGHVGDASGNMSNPLYRRQGQRRDINHTYNSVRHHSHPRSFNGRLGRGHPMHNSGQIRHPDLGQPAAGPAIPTNWNRWNGPR